jgi:Ca2+-binding EF-hand superfamily protein
MVKTTWTHEELSTLWREFDYDGNGLVSLGEIDRAVTKLMPAFHDAHYKPALVSDANARSYATQPRTLPSLVF